MTGKTTTTDYGNLKITDYEGQNKKDCEWNW